MKKRILLGILLSILVIAPITSEAKGSGGHSYRSSRHSSSGHVNSSHSHVRGYTKSNGTHVNSYNRTSSNSTKLDNYSTKGNINPYTGRSGTHDPYK